MSQNNPLLNPPVLSHSPYHPNRPPSPATTAAAMSLGALAAAASMATPNPSHSLQPSPPPPPPLPHYYQTYLDPLTQPRPPPQSHLPELIAPQPTSSFALQNHHVPAMSQIARPKQSPTPVAPAPTNMHPSQQPTHPNGKPKQKRYRATPEQLRHLLAQFETNPSPSTSELQQLALSIRMPPQSAVLWFKNRRARVPHKKSDKRPVSPNQDELQTETVNEPEKPKLAESANPVVDAAKSMADMANIERVAGRNITNEPRLDIPLRSPSRSPPPLYRNRAADAIPFDIGLASRLASNAKRGAVFSTPTTLRRPRVVPPTPRLLSQRAYEPGDMVEVLETTKGICRSWYSAIIIDASGLNELSLGVSAATICGNLPKLSGLAGREMENADEQDVDGGDSPRTVRSPAASPTPSIAKVTYLVEFCHRYEDANDSSTKLKEEVLASRIRPAPPFSESDDDWRPDQGDAVEVLRDGAWFVAVIQAFAVRKGYMVSFESGDVQWVRRHGLRPYQIWRGGDSWVTKTKAPLPVVRKSVGLSVTHPPGGKRKRRFVESTKNNGNGMVSEGRETRARSKRAKTVVVDESGPDGLPEGWRRMEGHNYGKRQGGGTTTKGESVYIAPDGNRLRSLKEAQRYVTLMGPG